MEIKINVIGDVHYDIFAENESQSKPEKGGASFVEKILGNKECVKKTLENKNKNKNKKIKNKDSVDVFGGFTQLDSNDSNEIHLGSAFSLIWNIKKYSDVEGADGKEKVYRCEDRLGVQKEPYNYDEYKYVSFNQTKFKKINDKNGVCNFFLMECIGDHEEEASEKKYNSLFNNEYATDLISKVFKKTIIHPERTISFPNLFWILHHDIPDILFKKKTAGENGTKVKEIEDELKNRSIIFLNANSLREQGIYIRTHVSWESAAQDYIRALYSDPFLSGLRKYRHVITRFGLTGAIYSYRLGTSRWLHRLLLDPTAPKTGLFRNVSTEGDVIGYQSIFATCVLNEIVSCVYKSPSPDEVKVTENVCNGIRKAMVSCQDIFKGGLGSKFEGCLDAFFEGCTDAFSKNLNSSNWNKIFQARIPVANPAWSILVQSAEYKLSGTAEDIVFKGIDAAINNIESSNEQNSNNEAIWAPTLKFGANDDLVVIDRREIENYRVIYSLINRALNKGAEKILSIAVFGPPGSGKSYTVKKLIESAYSDSGKHPVTTINMTNIDNKKMLDDEIIKACWDKYKVGKVPIIFFDEFDCKLGDEDLGWLKSFISPMEDFDVDDLIADVAEGRKQDLEINEKEALSKEKVLNNIKDLQGLHMEDSKVIGVLEQIEASMKSHEELFMEECQTAREVQKKPIFIFAGGTSHNYLDFCHEDSSLSEEQKVYFANAKGPDFVSRLRGHINILGINRVDDYDDGYIVRRAILLRSLLLNRLSNSNKDKFNEKSNLELFHDPSLIKAMLKVSNYKHGARSMTAIINMSSTIGGSEGKLVGSCLPTLPQLNMHVNGKEFLDQVIFESQSK